MSTQEQPTLQQILQPVMNHLQRVEELVMENMETDIPLLTEVGQYILKSGGKRVRPAMLLFAAGMFGEINEKACQAANIIEYIHTATLLHDDVVDNAAIRRKKESARSIWGNEASVLVGDYLFTVSFKFLATMESMEMVSCLSLATTMMARGEILQLTRSNDTATEEDYIEIVHHKTASLMGAAMQMGAILAGASPADSQLVYDCGKNIGIAFQMIDDALDYQLNNDQFGKEQGTDLKERKITLPLSHLLAEASEEDQERVLDILDEDIITDDHVLEVANLMKQYGSVEYTLRRADEYASLAKENLSTLPQTDHKKGIELLSDYVVRRNI